MGAYANQVKQSIEQAKHQFADFELMQIIGSGVVPDDVRPHLPKSVEIAINELSDDDKAIFGKALDDYFINQLKNVVRGG